MINFKGFLNDPVYATFYGYEAWYIDYCALWCDRLSIKMIRKCLEQWKELFTHYTVSEFPVEFLKLILGTTVFLSIPIMFPLYALVSYSLKDKLIREMREKNRRSPRNSQYGTKKMEK
jgi:hypothetical protein